LNRTTAAWKDMQKQIADFNALLGKNQLQPLTLTPTTLSDAACTFASEAKRNAKRLTNAPTTRGSK
jgi:hypothetical protein